MSGTSAAISAQEPASDPVADSRDKIAQARDAALGRSIEVGWPETGDTLWTCGFYGAVVPLRSIAEARQRLRFSCVSAYHGFIRDKTEAWNPEDPQGLHYACVGADLLDASDRILCISHDARSSLIAFAQKCDRATPAATVLMPGRMPSPGKTEAALPHELTRRRFALCVGPVDRYLNLGLLVRAWEVLVEQPDFILDLVIVGSAADCDEAQIIEIEASTLFGNRILWFDECRDNVLSLISRRADATCYVQDLPTEVQGKVGTSWSRKLWRPVRRYWPRQ